MKEHCRETLERAYLFLDGEVLSEHERVEIRHHIEECRPCYEQYGLQREITILVARLKGCETCPDQLRARIASLLEE
jgi:mycothiol system anti-sigma-R factor